MKEICFLFIHGIAGSPRVFDFLKTSLPSGVDVFFHVLSGHGEDSRSFGRKGYPLWRKEVLRRADALLSEYRRIVLVGHSMGCLLSMEIALSYPDRVSPLFLLCPPLKIGVRPVPMLSSMARVLFARPPRDEAMAASWRCSGLPLSRNPFSYIPWARPFCSLLWNIPKVRKRIGNLSVPYLAFLAGKDELVSIKAIRHLPPVGKAVLLPESGHYLFSPEEEKTIRMAFSDFVSNGYHFPSC